MSTPNPYAAPKAALEDASAGTPANFLPTGRKVASGRGWSWLAEGWDFFKQQPGMWIAVVLVAAVIFIVLHFVPLLGSLAAMVLAPVFAGGIVIGCRAQREGGQLQIEHLFAGFRGHLGSLVAVGLIYLAAIVVIALVVGLATGAGMWTLFSAGADPVALGAAGLTILLAFLIMLALMLPVFMAIWFAPPLVVFHGQAAAEAMKNSFIACLKNMLPFLIYSLALFLLSIAASIPFGLGWLVLGPMIAASLYTGYRDIFFE
ncbi:MAG TPA: BPSS1780 family membrane protein [Burkholderiales bacterium]|nr:BPSS1780 family membrane protein [Burkholderiales bacterium]